MPVITLDRLLDKTSQIDTDLFRTTSQPSDRLVIYRTFAPDITRQIPHFDSDETLELVLRFPGLPDAIAGRIRGMQSYDHWLYYRLDTDGRKFGFHYARGQAVTFIEDYLDRLQKVLGRPVEVDESSEVLETLQRDNGPREVASAAPLARQMLTETHPSVQAVIFDLDNTLAATDHLRTFRETGNRQGLAASLAASPLDVHQDLVHVLTEVSAHVPVALVTVSPRWYAERLLETLCPDIKWASVVTYADVTRPKPYPDAFRIAAQHMNVPPDQVLVVGDHRNDVEAAYHAQMQVALATWHVEDSNALKLIPDAVLTEPSDLLMYLTSPALGRPFLEAWLMDEDWEALDYAESFPAWTDVPDQEVLSVGVLGRYFPRYGQTLHLHNAHLLSQQIVEKERPGPFCMPDTWLHPLGTMLAAHDVDIVTVIPAKPGKDQRLERMLDQLQGEHGAAYMPDLLAFEPGTPDVKTLSVTERYPTIKQYLRVQGDCRGKRVLVLDDVLTQGATLQAATERLREAGAVEVRRLAIVRTISPKLFTVEDEVRFCPRCREPLRLQRRKRDGAPFWGCTAYFTTGCDYKVDATQPG